MSVLLFSSIVQFIILLPGLQRPVVVGSVEGSLQHVLLVAFAQVNAVVVHRFEVERIHAIGTERYRSDAFHGLLR